MSEPSLLTRCVISAAIAAILFLGPGVEARAQSAPAPPAVTVSVPLQKQIVEWQEFTGQFAAVDYIELRARVSGYLTEIHFEDGQIVKKGDLLFVIDPRPFQAALDSAKAQVEQANAQVELAQRNLQRSSTLVKRSDEPVSVYDQRVSEFKVATAMVDVAKAAVTTAELNLEYTRITAPIDGRISNHLVSIGNLVNGGDGGASTLLTTIVSLDPIYFNFDMSEGDYLAYQRAAAKGLMLPTGDSFVEVTLHLADERGWPHKGTMNFVDNRVNRESGTIRIRAQFPNHDYFLTPGLFGRTRIPGSEPYMAILIPGAAIVADQSHKEVLTVADDGTVVPKVIRPGPSYENLRIVRSGLAASDRIVVDGLLRARPGAKVTPQPGNIELEPETN
ncbi:MAG TPA: efflux RND transporter periplasmic adaptor subunit [Stellaceae bacterium]|nr:efflux RND transporter periplasmic adaptor subunit [Stellaceae bacterium]